MYLVPHLIYGTDWTCNENPDITDLFRTKSQPFFFSYTSCVDSWINYRYAAFHFILELILCFYLFKFLRKNRQPENWRYHSFHSFVAHFLLLLLWLEAVLVFCVIYIFVLMTTVSRRKVYARNKLISMVVSKLKFKCSDGVLKNIKNKRKSYQKLCWPV